MKTLMFASFILVLIGMIDTTYHEKIQEAQLNGDIALLEEKVDEFEATDMITSDVAQQERITLKELKALGVTKLIEKKNGVLLATLRVVRDYADLPTRLGMVLQKAQLNSDIALRVRNYPDLGTRVRF